MLTYSIGLKLVGPAYATNFHLVGTALLTYGTGLKLVVLCYSIQFQLVTLMTDKTKIKNTIPSLM